MKLFIKTVNPTGATHSASVILLHGSGDNGRNFNEWINDMLGHKMEYPHIKLLYPTAPAQPYTPLDGSMSNVWFDRQAISIKAPEVRSSLEQIYMPIKEILNEELSAGISADRIIIGGFSMGGALALHTGYHLNNKLGGIFACSSFLNHGSIVYDSLEKTKATINHKLPELLMFHGDSDTLVPLEWGKETFDKLSTFGINGNFVTLKGTEHEITESSISNIQNWIEKKLPLLDSDH